MIKQLGVIVDFDQKIHIEKVLIPKLAECTVRLTCIQSLENAMFDLASSEAGGSEGLIKSLDSGSDRLTQAIDRVGSIDWEFDSRAFSRKTVVLDEIDRQNIRGGWKSETNALRYLQNWNDSNLLMID